MAIKCRKCKADNPSDSKYCKECAAPLQPSEEAILSRTKTSMTSEPVKKKIVAGKYKFWLSWATVGWVWSIRPRMPN